MRFMRFYVVLSVFTLLISVFTMNSQTVLADHSGHPANPVDQNNWKVFWDDAGGTSWDGLRIGATVQYKPAGVYDIVIDTAKIPRIRLTYFNGTLYRVFTDELPPPSPHDHNFTYNHFDKHNISTYGWYFHHYYYYGCTADQWNSTKNGCYKYEVYWSFRNDNQKLSAWVYTYGPGFTGVGNPPGQDHGNPIYRFHWRIDTAVLGFADDGFASYTSSGWSVKTIEFTEDDLSPYTPEGYKWKTFDFPESGESLYVDPYVLDTVTWHDGTTKRASIHAVKWYSGEDQGDSTGWPGGYVSGETIATPSPNPTTGSDITKWYVGYMNWDARLCSPSSPCISGPDLYAKSFP